MGDSKYVYIMIIKLRSNLGGTNEYEDKIVSHNLENLS